MCLFEFVFKNPVVIERLLFVALCRKRELSIRLNFNVLAAQLVYVLFRWYVTIF